MSLQVYEGNFLALVIIFLGYGDVCDYRSPEQCILKATVGLYVQASLLGKIFVEGNGR